MPNNREPDMSSCPDQEGVERWCRAAAGGSADAFEQLLCLYHHRLYGLVVYKTGGDWHGLIEPDDVLQNAYVDIFSRMGQFQYQGAGSFFQWASRIVDHHLVDQLRHLRRQKRDVAREVRERGTSSSRHEQFLDGCLRDSLTPSVHLRRREACSLLMSCIARLPEVYREVVQRVHLDGDEIPKVAADLDRTENAVRHLSKRAIKCLQECLARASIMASRA